MTIEYRASSCSQLWEKNGFACISAVGTVVWVTGHGYVGGKRQILIYQEATIIVALERNCMTLMHRFHADLCLSF